MEKRDLEESGLEKLVTIKASMNRGLTDLLKNGFPINGAAQRVNINNGKMETQ
jgi:hypothetical protein